MHGEVSTISAGNAVRQKNVFIEYLRFIFSIIIMVYHMHALGCIDKSAPLYPISGNFCVDFFAMLSGFLMAKSLCGYPGKYPDKGVFSQSFLFMRKKWKTILIYNIVSFLMAFTTRSIATKDWGGSLVEHLMRNISEPLLLSTTGIKTVTFNYNGAAWYLSAMFLCMIILVPLCLYKPDLYKYCCLPMGFIVLGILMRLHGTLIATETHFYGVLCLGNLRIMGGLLIGSFCYYAYNRIRTDNAMSERLSGSPLIIMRCVTILCILAFIASLFRKIVNNTTPALEMIIALLVLGAFLFFDTWIPRKKIITDLGIRLGKFSLPLYLNHKYFAFIIKGLDLDISVKHKIILYFCLSFLSACLVDLICKRILKIKTIQKI